MTVVFLKVFHGRGNSAVCESWQHILHSYYCQSKLMQQDVIRIYSNTKDQRHLNLWFVKDSQSFLLQLFWSLILSVSIRRHMHEMLHYKFSEVEEVFIYFTKRKQQHNYYYASAFVYLEQTHLCGYSTGWGTIMINWQIYKLKWYL